MIDGLALKTMAYRVCPTDLIGSKTIVRVMVNAHHCVVKTSRNATRLLAVPYIYYSTPPNIK